MTAEQNVEIVRRWFDGMRSLVGRFSKTGIEVDTPWAADETIDSRS